MITSRATPALTAADLSRPRTGADGLGPSRWRPARHLTLLSDLLAGAAVGEHPRLVVEMPVRHGKSELCSHYFPVWVLELWPARRIIVAAHGGEFAAGRGRLIRNTIESWPDRLDVRLDPRSTAANRFDTTAGGGVYTVGVGGSVTGRGADVLVIDDPVKDARQANSQLYRERLWDWYQSVARTRVEPGGAVVVVMSRWHEDDMAARLVREGDESGHPWTVLHLPARAEPDDALGRAPGEPLWPDRWPEAALAEAEAEVGPYAWAALYQQRPRPREGLGFWALGDLARARAVCPELDALERLGLERVEVAVDPPGSETGAEAGIMVGARLRRQPGDGPQRRGVLLADVSRRGSPEEWARAAVEAFRAWRADVIVAESNNGGDMVRAVLQAVDPTVPVRLVTASRGKEIRAEPVATLDRQGLIWWATPGVELADQLTSWAPGLGMESPDRLDAYVWCFTSLLVQGRDRRVVGIR